LFVIFMSAHKACRHASVARLRFVFLAILLHAVPIHGLGWEVARVEHLRLHKLIPVAVSESTLKKMPVPCYLQIAQSSNKILDWLSFST
jgi:hypothetical protein